MRGIDYKSLFEDLEIKLEAIEEKALKMGEARLDDTEFSELVDMICDALSGATQDLVEETSITQMCGKAAETLLDSAQEE